MSRVRGEVMDWFAAGRVPRGREYAVLRAAAMIPAPTQWRAFLGQLSLWLGTLALAAAVIFFFAFNWQDLGRLAKIGLAEAAIVAGLLACWRLDPDGLAGKAVLTLLSLLVGALLALTGQIYQTGADTFELFAYWAVLILPWVLVGRFAPLWLVWLALLDTGLYLFLSSNVDDEVLVRALFALNGVALILWEAGHRSGLPWLRESWLPRLIAIASTAAATMLAVSAAIDGHGRPAFVTALVYLAYVGGIYGWYRHVRPDLFMLAAGLLSLIVVVAAFLFRHMLDAGSGAFLFIGLIVIGMSAAGGLWLRSVAQGEAA